MSKWVLKRIVRYETYAFIDQFPVCLECEEPALKKVLECYHKRPHGEKDRYFKEIDRFALSKFCPHCGQPMTGFDPETIIEQDNLKELLAEAKEEEKRLAKWRPL